MGKKLTATASVIEPYLSFQIAFEFLNGLINSLHLTKIITVKLYIYVYYILY